MNSQSVKTPSVPAPRTAATSFQIMIRSPLVFRRSVPDRPAQLLLKPPDALFVPGRQAAGLVDARVQIALNVLCDPEIFHRRLFGGGRSAIDLALRRPAGKEIEIVELGAPVVQRPHAFHHQPVSINVDAETWPEPSP